MPESVLIPLQNGHKFVLQKFEMKKGKFRRGTAQWKQYTFCYIPGQVQYYKDLNKVSNQVCSMKTRT
jgi:hypothetical protein